MKASHTFFNETRELINKKRFRPERGFFQNHGTLEEDISSFNDSFSFSRHRYFEDPKIPVNQNV
jgi:hypothetical protein